MRIKKSKLNRIIKEELDATLAEVDGTQDLAALASKAYAQVQEILRINDDLAEGFVNAKKLRQLSNTIADISDGLKNPSNP